MSVPISALTDDRLILPHPHDRYRIVGLLLREIREQRYGKHQSVFAEHITARLRERDPRFNGKVDQSNISRVENVKELAKKTICEGREPPRQDFLRCTLVGLDLETETTSQLLAFTEGTHFKPLTALEIQQNLGRLPRAGEIRKSRSYGDDLAESHYGVMRFFKQVFAHKFQTKKRIESVTMHHAPEAGDASSISRIIYSHEKSPGQFMRMSKYPGFPILENVAVEHFAPRLVKGKTIADVEKEFRQRRLLFHRRLLTFGERNIHSLAGLRRYAKRVVGHHLPVNIRRRHLLNLIRMLVSYPSLFKVGLVPDEVETELLINCTRWVLLRPTSYHRFFQPDSFHAGPNLIFWSRAQSMMRTQLEFEDCWKHLSEGGFTDPKTVATQIEETLRMACREEPDDGDSALLSALRNPRTLRLSLKDEDCAPESFFCEHLLEKVGKPKRDGGKDPARV